MSNELNLSDTIQPKSDQLNADDLISGSITVTIQGVKRGSKEQPVIIAINGGHQPYKPCKSMLRVLIKAWGDDGSKWVGESLTLYNDPSVKFGGVAMGGIRISHITGIKAPLSMMLTTTRARRNKFTVEPLKLEVKMYPENEFNNVFPEIEAAVKKGMTFKAAVQECEKYGKLTPQQTERIKNIKPEVKS